MDRPGTTSTTPSPTVQGQRLVSTGVAELLGRTPQDVRAAATALERAAGSAEVLLVPAEVADVPALLHHVRHAGRPGFVVADMTDLDAFAPTVPLPDGDWYGLVDPRRGDELRDVSPADAQEQISSWGRTPLTIVEGILWLIQAPALLNRNHCFMTIGSRVRKGDGHDSRTPALWISNGTGRDGRENRHAPKLGWCWWNNRHTWLGIAHAASRIGTAADAPSSGAPRPSR